jgi:hypothetical protein
MDGRLMFWWALVLSMVIGGMVSVATYGFLLLVV